jgi:hypothetical protein
MSYLKKFKKASRYAFSKAKSWASKTRGLTKFLVKHKHKHPILAILHKTAKMKGYGYKRRYGNGISRTNRPYINEKIPTKPIINRKWIAPAAAGALYGAYRLHSAYNNRPIPEDFSEWSLASRDVFDDY